MKSVFIGLVIAAALSVVPASVVATPLLSCTNDRIGLNISEFEALGDVVAIWGYECTDEGWQLVSVRFL